MDMPEYPSRDSYKLNGGAPHTVTTFGFGFIQSHIGIVVGNTEWVCLGWINLGKTDAYGYGYVFISSWYHQCSLGFPNAIQYFLRCMFVNPDQ